MAKREKRTISGRLVHVNIGATLQLQGRWNEDPARKVQITVFETDIPKLEEAIAQFKRGSDGSGGGHEVPPPEPVPTNADGRKTFKKIGDYEE